jgi:glutamyl/glutaminyl-tRNA synthetase
LDVLLAYIETPYTREYWTGYVEEDPMPNKAPIQGVDVWARLNRLSEAAAKDRAYVLECIKLEQERVLTLADFGEACEFFLVENVEFDQKGVDKWFGQPHVPALFDFLLERFSNSPTASVEWCEGLIKEFAEKQGFEKIGPVVHPTRVALTGKTVGPGLFELMSVLGPARMVKRLERAKALIPS